VSAAETHSLRVRGLREMTMDEMWEHAMPQRRCDETIGGWRLGAGLIAMRYAEFQTSIGALPVVRFHEFQLADAETAIPTGADAAPSAASRLPKPISHSTFWTA
jgi:hypothetical protein